MKKLQRIIADQRSNSDADDVDAMLEDLSNIGNQLKAIEDQCRDLQGKYRGKYPIIEILNRLVPDLESLRVDTVWKYGRRKFDEDEYSKHEFFLDE